MEIAQDLIFAFDSCPKDIKLSCNHIKDKGADSPREERQDSCARQSYLNNRLSVSSLDETWLQREIHGFLSVMFLGNEDAHVDHGSSLSASHTSRTLLALCSALRQRGLEASLHLPNTAGSVSCGRRSTGSGGQCAAGVTRPCYFCSRQPFAVVRGPLSGPLTHTQQQSRCQLTPFGPPPPPEASAQGPGREEVVVDPALRELFRVTPSTSEYRAIVSELPEVWVGPLEELQELAARVCDAMMINFRCQGLDVPPWRRRASIMARWDHIACQQPATSPTALDGLSPFRRQPLPQVPRTPVPALPSNMEPQPQARTQSQPLYMRDGGSAPQRFASLNARNSPAAVAVPTTPFANWAQEIAPAPLEGAVTAADSAASDSAAVVSIVEQGPAQWRPSQSSDVKGAVLGGCASEHQAPAVSASRGSLTPIVVVYGFSLSGPAHAS